jgi:hypothetical protein
VQKENRRTGGVTEAAEADAPLIAGERGGSKRWFPVPGRENSAGVADGIADGSGGRRDCGTYTNKRWSGDAAQARLEAIKLLGGDPESFEAISHRDGKFRHRGGIGRKNLP